MHHDPIRHYTLMNTHDTLNVSCFQDTVNKESLATRWQRKLQIVFPTFGGGGGEGGEGVGGLLTSLNGAQPGHKGFQCFRLPVNRETCQLGFPVQVIQENQKKNCKNFKMLFVN